MSTTVCRRDVFDPSDDFLLQKLSHLSLMSHLSLKKIVNMYFTKQTSVNGFKVW
ncbi:MAG: hypothetical protein LBP59_04890 [Planctomycetaceae bacterium]|nr:hypothetical protein [Planctomycetaceae bacterium]